MPSALTPEERTRLDRVIEATLVDLELEYEHPRNGAFFVKLKCFCFEEQTLQPGETMDFPVVFYVDPDLAKEHTLDGLTGITLSYTYFASKNGQPVASVAGATPPKL